MPAPTERLRFRNMTEADLDLMAELLGDPEVMRYYPRPKTRDEALDWIQWNQRNYADYGYGLWIIETHEGKFIGDCGLTWQPVDEEQALEVGYHVVRARQRRGLATEAGRACVDFAFGAIGVSQVIAIIDPDNTASRRVAEKIGMGKEREAEVEGRPVVVYGRRG